MTFCPQRVRDCTPDFRVIAIDETHCFTDPAFIAKTGAIYCVYLYDKAEVTHCCEITPSYTLYPLYHSWERAAYDNWEHDEIERDRIDAELVDCIDYDVRYLHCRNVDAMEADLKDKPFRYKVYGDYGGAANMTQAEYDELRESLEEHERCNPSCA